MQDFVTETREKIVSAAYWVGRFNLFVAGARLLYIIVILNLQPFEIKLSDNITVNKALNVFLQYPSSSYSLSHFAAVAWVVAQIVASLSLLFSLNANSRPILTFRIFLYADFVWSALRSISLPVIIVEIIFPLIHHEDAGVFYNIVAISTFVLVCFNVALVLYGYCRIQMSVIDAAELALEEQHVLPERHIEIASFPVKYQRESVC